MDREFEPGLTVFVWGWAGACLSFSAEPSAGAEFLSQR